MTDLTTTTPLYSARPKITLDGKENELLDAGLLSMSVHENEDGLYRCELCFGNWGSNSEPVGFLYFDREIFDFGRRLTIEAGDGDAVGNIFNGRITAMEGRFMQDRPPEIVVLAEDRMQDLRMLRRTRTFEDVSVGDVVTQIAREHGMDTEIDIDSPDYRVLAQLNQSDLAFLRERARAIDAEIWIDGDKLYTLSRTRRKTDELKLTYGQRLHEFSVIADLANQRTHLAVGGWDISAKESLEHEIDKSAIQSELNGGISGSDVLESTFGRRRESIVHLVPASDEEARTLAAAYYRRMARKFVTGRGVSEGDGRLRAGSHVTIESIGNMFSGKYYITEVQHTFTLLHGFRTYFDVERPWIGEG